MVGRITQISGDSREITALQRRRFARHFPGLFAYVRTISRDYGAGLDTVVSSFDAALAADDLDEDAFVMRLFGAARRLCDAPPSESSEREVLSLTFDAQLTREQVSRLLDLPEDEVAAALLSGLRRLRELQTASETAGATIARGFAA